MDPRNPPGKPVLSSRLLTSAWPRPSCYRPLSRNHLKSLSRKTECSPSDFSRGNSMPRTGHLGHGASQRPLGKDEEEIIAWALRSFSKTPRLAWDTIRVPPQLLPSSLPAFPRAQSGTTCIWQRAEEEGGEGELRDEKPVARELALFSGWMQAGGYREGSAHSALWLLLQNPRSGFESWLSTPDCSFLEDSSGRASAWIPATHLDRVSGSGLWSDPVSASGNLGIWEAHQMMEDPSLSASLSL